MSEFVKFQQEARAKAWEAAKSILDRAAEEKRDLTAEENEQYGRISAELDERAAQIEKANELSAREERAAEAAAQFIPTATRSVDDSDLLRQIALGESRGHEFMSEKRTLVSSDNTVPKSFYNQVFQIARQAGPMLDVSDVINTTSGESLTIPTLTARSTATIKGQGTAISESEPTFSSITLGAFKYSFLVPVANELLTDAGFDLSSLIAEQAGNAIGYAVNNGLTNGTGTVEPTGLLTAASSAVTGSTGVSGVPSYENLVDLVYSLDGQARLLPGVGFLAGKSAIAAIRKIKDGAGNYIFTPATAGQPDQILGYRLIENPAMPAVATSAKSVLFGHLPSYKVRTAGGIKVAQSGDYAFDKDVTTFRVTMRVDGNLTHSAHAVWFKGGAS